MIWTLVILLGILNSNKDLGVSSKNNNLLSGWIHILPESKLSLRGKTNLNQYTCHCQPTKSTFEFSIEQKENTCIFKTTQFAINTTNLDCKNRLYNFNIKKSLESNKYPNIYIHLLGIKETGTPKYIFPYTWHQIEISTLVIIREKALIQNVPAFAFKISDKKYRLQGNHLMSMKEYQIYPSDLMFGMVKVDDGVAFHFDFLLEIR
ncbi:MAG: hypothetical protein IPM48_03520 [Saprospiraceae bacterium]|nr:hypothetical protein [Saprospiraceae bacterium]